MQKEVYKDHEELSRAVAVKIAGWIGSNPGKLVCLAAGDTPLAAFRHLVQLQEQGKVDLASVNYVGLDEWVGLGIEDRGSCRQVMTDGFYGPARIPGENMRVFDGLAEPAAECERIATWIQGHKGIGLTLLGVGMNGHVGFNEPGTVIKGICGLVELDDVTLNVGSKYFAQGPVPATGITVGLETLKKAGKIILMLSGSKKKDILARILTNPSDSDLPAARLLDHPDLDLCCDRQAVE